MNKYEMLLVRACKSKEPFTRIQSLYKRKYLVFDQYYDQYYDIMINDLSDLCDKYNLCTINKYNKELNNIILRELYFTTNNYGSLNFNEVKKLQLMTLISIIRYISVDKFDNFIPPKKFK